MYDQDSVYVYNFSIFFLHYQINHYSGKYKPRKLFKIQIHFFSENERNLF